MGKNQKQQREVTPVGIGVFTSHEKTFMVSFFKDQGRRVYVYAFTPLDQQDFDNRNLHIVFEDKDKRKMTTKQLALVLNEILTDILNEDADIPW